MPFCQIPRQLGEHIKISVRSEDDIDLEKLQSYMNTIAENYVAEWTRLGPIGPNTTFLAVEYALQDARSHPAYESQVIANLTTLPTNSSITAGGPATNTRRGKEGFQLVISQVILDESDSDSQADGEASRGRWVLFRKTFWTYWP
jgi:hypothetical protein